MGFASTLFNAATLSWRPGYLQNISDKMMFGMPQMGEETAVILGATRATLLLVDEAVRRGHQRFVIVGGKPIGDENVAFTRLIEKSCADSGLKIGYGGEILEKDFARYSLETYLGIPAENIVTFDDDTSTNLQQNFEVLKAHGFDKLPAIEIYGLAGTARRALMTARKVWSDSETVLSVHNVYPHGFNGLNWKNSITASMYVMSEAEKVLAPEGQVSNYERRGFCVPVDVAAEIQKAARRAGTDNGLKYDGHPHP